MKDVEKVRFDNPVYCFARKLVFKLDNALFNRHGSAGMDYQPTRYVLVLPYFCGLIFAAIAFFSGVFRISPGKAAILPALLCLTIMVLLNIWFNFDNVCGFRNPIKKLLYPIFIATVTLVFFFLVMAVCGILFPLAIIALFLMALWMDISSWGSSSTPINYDTGHGEESILVDDGTEHGRYITRTIGQNNWHDDFGNRYEKSGGGFIRKF